MGGRPLWRAARRRMRCGQLDRRVLPWLLPVDGRVLAAARRRRRGPGHLGALEHLASVASTSGAPADRAPMQEAAPCAPVGSKPAIALQDAAFRYPDAPADALDAIGLSIPYGQHIAILGRSGAGKSTLKALIHGDLFAHARVDRDRRRTVLLPWRADAENHERRASRPLPVWNDALRQPLRWPRVRYARRSPGCPG